MIINEVPSQGTKIFDMKNKVDPEIPLVKVLPNNTAEKNGGSKMIKTKKRRTSGQFSVSNKAKEKRPQTLDKISRDAGFDLVLGMNSTRGKEGFSKNSSTQQDENDNIDGKRSRQQSLIDTIQGNPAIKAVSKWKNFVSTRRCSSMKLQNYEVVNLRKLWDKEFDNKQNTMKDECFGFLEESEDGTKYEKNQSLRRKQNKKKALISYFVTLADPGDEKTSVDFNLVDQLLQAGADINIGDKYGQTVLHEVARIWHPDVAEFLIERGEMTFSRSRLHRNGFQKGHDTVFSTGTHRSVSFWEPEDVFWAS